MELQIFFVKSENNSSNQEISKNPQKSIELYDSRYSSYSDFADLNFHRHSRIRLLYCLNVTHKAYESCSPS